MALWRKKKDAQELELVPCKDIQVSIPDRELVVMGGSKPRNFEVNYEYILTPGEKEKRALFVAEVCLNPAGYWTYMCECDA